MIVEMSLLVSPRALYLVWACEGKSSKACQTGAHCTKVLLGRESLWDRYGHTDTDTHTHTLGDPKPPDQVYTNMLFKHRHTNTQTQTQIDTQTQENKDNGARPTSWPDSPHPTSELKAQGPTVGDQW